NIIATIADQFPKDYKVLLSLEDKTAKHLYPKSWIILQEPLKDIHSLIYFSKIVVASGDSMAREGSLLGVPSIYCGIREMTANKKMIELNMLFHLKSEAVPEFMIKFINNNIEIQQQDEFRKKLLNEWDDVTQFIKNKILQYAK